MSVDHSLREYGWDLAESTVDHKYALPAIFALLPPKQSLDILDAVCGNGAIAGKLAELGHHVMGIDLSKDGILLARKQKGGDIFGANRDKR